MHTAWIRWTASLATLGALALASPLLRADEQAPQPAPTPRDADATRIAAAGHPLKWNWVPPGRNERFGHAETLVHAPVDQVRRLVLDFANYKQLAQSITRRASSATSPTGRPTCTSAWA